MSKQKKGEIVDRFRKRFDIKMAELGSTYQNIDLYQQASSHLSFINDFNMNRLGHNERLGFLDDAVLGLMASQYLFDKHPNLPEGDLTKIHTTAVCEPSLVIFVNKIGLNEMILLGKGEKKAGGHTGPSLMSDAFETFIEALYLDQGLDIAWEFAEKVVLLHVEQNELLGVVDFKAQFQEYVHQQNRGDVIYNLMKKGGPAHHRLLTPEVILQGEAIVEDKGKTKKESEQRTAESAYKQLE